MLQSELNHVNQNEHNSFLEDYIVFILYFNFKSTSMFLCIKAHLPSVYSGYAQQMLIQFIHGVGGGRGYGGKGHNTDGTENQTLDCQIQCPMPYPLGYCVLNFDHGRKKTLADISCSDFVNAACFDKREGGVDVWV